MNLGLEGHEPALPSPRAMQLGEECLQLGERIHRQRVCALAPDRLVADQTRLAQHAQMAADRGPTHLEFFGNFACIQRLVAQHPQDLTTDWICQSVSDRIHAETVTILLHVIKRAAVAAAPSAAWARGSGQRRTG